VAVPNLFGRIEPFDVNFHLVQVRLGRDQDWLWFTCIDELDDRLMILEVGDVDAK
jgi:hypothetical protein